MQTIQIPYYTSTLDLHVEEKNLLQVVTAKMHEYDPGKSEVELIREGPGASHRYPTAPGAGQGQEESRSCHQRPHPGRAQ